MQYFALFMSVKANITKEYCRNNIVNGQFGSHFVYANQVVKTWEIDLGTGLIRFSTLELCEIDQFPTFTPKCSQNSHFAHMGLDYQARISLAISNLRLMFILCMLCLENIVAEWITKLPSIARVPGSKPT